MLYENHQRIIFCRNPWIRFKSCFSMDELIFWTSAIGAVIAALLPWGGQ